jgi:PAS domain S-box-containing protein
MNGHTLEVPYPPHALLHAMAEAAPTAVILVAPASGLVLYANRMGHVFARDAEPIAGRAAKDVLPQPIAEALAQVRCSGAPLRQDCLRLPPGAAGDGITVWDITYAVLPAAMPDMPAILVTAYDVTRHVLARQEAEQARDTLDALLTHIPEGITIAYGPNVRVERVSACGLEMARRSSLELIGQDALQHGQLWEVLRPGEDRPVPPEDRPMARAIRTGAVTRNETLMMGRPDGTKIPLLCSAGPIRSSDGRVIGAVLCWRDVTELMAAQDALAASESRLRAILQQIPAAIFLIDSAEGESSFQNDRLAKVLANPTLSNAEARETLRGWALHADGTPYELDEFPSRRAFAQGVTIEGEPMIYRRPDGRIVDLEMYAGPIRDATGRVIAAVGVVNDVTERKRQEEALRESEARFRVAIEAGGLATWEIDLVESRTPLDATFARLLGLPTETFAGSRDEGRALIHPEDLPRVRAELEAAIAARGTLLTETRALTTEGRVVWLSVHGRVVVDATGKPLRVAGVVRDVTARRNREDALREALAARELLVREADHRIKNSLQLICSVLTLQKARLPTPELGAALDDAISRVQAVAEAHRALHQSRDLRTVDFGTMLNDLCAHAANLSPSITFACHCPEPIDLDTERAIPLGLIVSELLTNAAKYAYGEAGGTVTLSALAEQGHIAIAVADQGQGIPAESRGGRGIGSRIIAAVAKQIGATVDTISGPDGTTVRLRFSR